MKKKSINLNKKLSLNKETITGLNNKLQEQVVGGISGKVCVPVSGTGCGCDMRTCGIIICSAAAACGTTGEVADM